MSSSFTVLIPDGESQFSLFVAHCLAQFPDVKIHVLSSERWAPIRFSRSCHSFTYNPLDPNEQVRLDFLANLAREHRINVLLPTDTKWISFVVANQKKLASFVAVAPMPDQKSFGLANNKWWLAKFLEENQIPRPPTLLVSADDVFEKKLQDMVFPVLLKPVTGWGGEGIERFEDFPSVKRHLEQHKPDDKKECYIIQSLLPGVVVGVNILARKGTILAMTMQKGIIPNTQEFAAAGGIRFVHEERFFSIAQRLVSTLGWTGFANIDTLYDFRDDQLKILEINGRFWGSLRGSLVAGVNFPYLACLAALDIPFQIPDYNQVYYIHSKTALRQGLLKLLRQPHENGFSFWETGLRFLLNDPLAELLRAYRQELLEE